MFKNNPFGAWGVILGLLAFGAGFMHFWFGPIETDTRTVEQKIVDKTFSFKDSIAATIKGEHSLPKHQKPVVDINMAVNDGTIVMALLAMALAVFSFLKREDLRYTGTALVLGGATLAFQFLLVAMGVVVILAIIFFLTAQFIS